MVKRQKQGFDRSYWVRCYFLNRFKSQLSAVGFLGSGFVVDFLVAG
jgi:hypothetical protein